jgi:hypothetical protein
VQNGSFSEEGVQEVSNGSFSQEGSEELANGDFSNGSTGWNISQSGNDTIIIENGYALFNCPDNSNIFITQASVLTIGKTYKATFNVISIDSGGFNFAQGGGGTISGSPTINTTGTHTFTFVAATGTFGIKRALGSPNLLNGSITNISIKEVGQDWSLGTGWSIAEDKAVADGTTNNAISQTTISSVVGKSYKIDFTIDDYVTGNIRIYFGGVFTPFVNVNGVYSFYITATAVDALATSASGLFNGSVTNISVKEVGQNWDLQTGWSIAENKATFDETIGGAGNINQNNILASGKKYKLTFDTLETNGGNIAYRFGGGYTFIAAIQANTTHTVYGVGAGVQFTLRGADNFIGSVTNISIIEISTDTNLPRINYEGFSYQDALGSELVTNGGFDTDTGWTKQNGATISNGMANFIFSNSKILQSISAPTINKVYRVEFDSNQINLSTTAVIIYGNGFYGLSNIPSVGKNILYITTNLSGGSQINTFQLSAGANGSIDNVSAKEYLGQEVVPDSGCGSWLWEPQSTNLIEYSNDYADAYWIKSTSGSGIAPIVTSNYAISPDGTQNADRIQFNATTSGSNSDRSRIRTTLTLSDVTDYTFSFYAKSTDGTDQKISILFDNSQVSVKTITSEWQRFEATSQQFGTSSICGLDLRGGNASTSDILVYGIQVEQQSYATSYIPTEGSQVTRNQDVCTNGGSLASINSTEGTLYAEIAALANDGTNRAIALSDGSTSNVVRFYYSTTDNRIVGNVKSGGTTFFNFNNVLSSATDFLKVAISYRLNEFKMYVNGTLVFTDTSGNTPIGLNELAFDNGAGNDKFFGKTKALAVWKEALTDSELQSLTTI